MVQPTEPTQGVTFDTTQQQFGLDTCCGGALTLAEAAAHHGLEIEALLAALQEAAAPPKVR